MFKRTKNAGFTLVEMALVLVVIGLILGAVSIGKDMQRNAEYKKIKQKYIDQWEQAYNQFYDRMGYVIGDQADVPLKVINGSTFSTTDVDLFLNGNLPTKNGTALCNESSTFYLQTVFEEAGISLPPGRGINASDRYVYLDSNGNPQQLKVCFRWHRPASTAGNGNVMTIEGLTPDLARMLDSLIDSQVDGEAGRFRRISTDNASDPISSAAWPIGNVVNATSNAFDDTTQIITVNAALKMNQ